VIVPGSSPAARYINPNQDPLTELTEGMRGCSTCSCKTAWPSRRPSFPRRFRGKRDDQSNLHSRESSEGWGCCGDVRQNWRVTRRRFACPDCKRRPGVFVRFLAEERARGRLGGKFRGLPQGLGRRDGAYTNWDGRQRFNGTWSRLEKRKKIEAFWNGSFFLRASGGSSSTVTA